MTKIWLLSDLHQEFARDDQYGNDPHTAFDPAMHEPDDYDVIVLAGDIDVPLTGSLNWIAERFPGFPTLYVPGNHDFFVDGDEGQYTMLEQLDVGRELAGKLGIHLLSDDVVEIDGTRFIGSTLWTDFITVGRGDVRGKMKEAAGRYGMMDYRRIKRSSTADPTKRKRLRPEDTMVAHRVTRAFLEDTLALPVNGPTVVVSHHAPHPESLDPKHAGRLDWCYASNLSLIMEGPDGPDLWLHGHIHKAVDYTVGGTRIVANPRGYAFLPDERENGFDASLVVEVISHDHKLKMP